MHAGAQLVHHLLVELAHAPAGRPRLALEEHREQATIRDRPAAGHGHRPRIAAPFDHIGEPVPHDPWLELGELVGRVRAREHPEHTLKRLAGQRLERCGAAHQLQQRVDRELLADGHRNQLLSQDVERVARQHGGLDRAIVHALHDHGGLEQVAAVLGEHHALARLAHLVARPPDALQATGDRGGALDLDHEIDGAHVDPQLEAAGGDERRQPSGLELLLDLEPLLSRDAAVVGTNEVLAGELVEALGQPFREAPAVGEHDRGAVLTDQLQDPGVDGRPDARSQLTTDDGPARLLVHRQHLAQARHVLDRDDDLEIERLARPGVDDGHLATLTHPAQEPGDGLEGALGGAEADPLERRRGAPIPVPTPEALQALQAQREVRAALGAGDRVDLVHDHVLDPAQDLAGLAGQQQVQALGGRDQDVRRVAHEIATRVGRGIAGSAGDRDVWRLPAQPLSGEGDARQRRPQVALHVVSQRLERTHVEHPDGARRLAGRYRAGVLDEAFEAPQECGQRLAAAGRRVDQRVAAARDRGPAFGLGLGGRLERRFEPGPDGGPERREGVLDAHGHGIASIGRGDHFVHMF